MQHQQKSLKDLDLRVKRFATSLKRDFASEIDQNPSQFRSRLLGKLRVFLPRSRPGRKANPGIRQAADIFERDYKAKGKEGNWHEIAKKVLPEYGFLPIELQKFRRYQLRAAVHSFLYDHRSRLKRRGDILRESQTSVAS